IMQAEQIYASQNRDYMAGSGNTTGLAFMIEGSFASPPGPFNDTNAPDISAINDWQAPLAKIMGVKFNTGATLADRTERFIQLQTFPGFQCPDNNDVLMTPFSATSFGTVPFASYSIAFIFTLIPNTPNPYAPRVTNGAYGFGVFG